MNGAAAVDGDPRGVRAMTLRSVAAAGLLVAAVACGSPHRTTTTTLDAWRAYQRSVIADLENLAVRGSAATRSQDYASLGAVCQEGMAVVATAKAGPVAPDTELQTHYSLMEQFYEAGFSTCAAGTAVSADRSQPSLDRGNEELLAATARLMMLSPG